MNINKSKVIHFRRKRIPKTEQPFWLGERIEVVESYRYLNVELDSHLDFGNCIEQLSTAASRALGGLIGKTRNNYELGYRTFSRLYHACVTPILDYASGVWSGLHLGAATKIA